MSTANVPFAPARGWLYSGAVLTAWLCVHIYAVFFYNVTTSPIWVTAMLIALHLWLYTGIFIVAHDTMHGSLFPGRPHLNAWLGTGILFVYAGFDWKLLQRAHMAHHAEPGTENDPDFNAENPTAFWPWYIKFFTTYFSVRQIIILNLFTLIYMFIFGASLINILLMWALPAILSSVQLFYFGTYRTHKHGQKFPDHHNARTNQFPRWLSLLTCFHFGYHHEHHLFPHEPWWRLPYRKTEAS